MMGQGDDSPLRVWVTGQCEGQWYCMTCVFTRVYFHVQLTDCDGMECSQLARVLSCLPQLTINRDSGLDVSSPKHGKVQYIHTYLHVDSTSIIHMHSYKLVACF